VCLNANPRYNKRETRLRPAKRTNVAISIDDDDNDTTDLERSCVMLPGEVTERKLPSLWIRAPTSTDVALASRYNWTSLHIAAWKGHASVVRLLIKCVG